MVSYSYVALIHQDLQSAIYGHRDKIMDIDDHLGYVKAELRREKFKVETLEKEVKTLRTLEEEVKTLRSLIEHQEKSAEENTRKIFESMMKELTRSDSQKQVNSEGNSVDNSVKDSFVVMDSQTTQTTPDLLLKKG